MKKYSVVLSLLLVMAVCAVSVLAAGDAVDPLISLSYLNGTYRDTVAVDIGDKVNEADQSLREDVFAKLDMVAEAVSMDCAATWTETRMKSGDILHGSTGFSVMLLAGSAEVYYESGEVVNASTGKAVPSGSTLTANHRYMVAEDTQARFIVTSKTAVVDYMGYYSFTFSGAVDYNAMGSALKAMNLFRGSYTGYGSGFDLEVAPTRLQALIMFIRVLGEEEAALANTELPPFSDIYPDTNAARYVGYAYKMGYTNGYKDGTWRPGGATNVYQYTEFLLRALGYSSVDSGISISTAPERAKSIGLMTETDAATMVNEDFLRAHLVYLSYYALEVPDAKNGVPLRDILISKNVFSATDYAVATSLVKSSRLP